MITSIFVNHQAVQAADTVIENKARIDTEYPMSGASNFMMVTGNQFIHNTSPFSGRIMANSIVLKSKDIGTPGLNGSSLAADDTDYDDYFTSLENPAVIINDFNKSNGKILDKTTGMKNQLSNLSKMWQRNDLTGGGLSKNAEFATDTPLKDVIAEYSKDADKGQPDYIAPEEFTNLWANKSVPGTNGNLVNLPQYVDNGINKYEISEDPASNEYSLQQNIQDISHFYASLTGDADFWSSTDDIMNLKQSYTDAWPNTTVREKSNPIYITDPWDAVSDIVINIVAKKDDPTVNQTVRDKTKPYAVKVDGKKPVVAVSIDRAKVLDYNPNAQHMNIDFHFSDSFYTEKAGKKVLDADKIPYIVLNYSGFGDKRFDFKSGDGFYIGDLDHHVFTANPTGTGNYVKSIATEVGGNSPEDWNNRDVLKFGAHLVNNFTDTYDSDNYPESYNQEIQDNAGITGQTAAVSYTNRSPGTMLFGTMLIPHGSYYAGSASGGLYIGGVVAANNITLDNAIISPDHDKSVYGRDHDFPDMNEGGGGGKQPAIDAVDLVDQKANHQQIANNETAKFDYADGALTPAPNLGITGTLQLTNMPAQYGLYYRFNGQGDWHRYSDGVQTKNTVALNETLLADLNNQSKLNVGAVKSEAQQISYPLTKTSSIEFATTADANAATIGADEIETTATFKFTLEVVASLEVTVPARISFGTETLGQSVGEAKRTVAINEIQTAQKTIADTGTPEAPKVVVYNPLLSGFNLKLAYLDANDTKQNPFYITNNFKYNVNDAVPLPLAPDQADGEWIDGVLKRDSTPQSLITKISDISLESSSLQLHLPYSDTYKVSSEVYEAPMGWQLDL
ncbi:hypothetical protein FC90_GL000607 [Latilactobacillus graminis DSM 20719]|uniref:Uncharacterized protein n=1 Tax=Latilactobacillus graminis DSM 20719 TaxID=1423752 RepID=A0AA89L171_9LACO|nr:hypothetical protein FC90_GL000607 [Latilactobacillus graminis DSM 20719]